MRIAVEQSRGRVTEAELKALMVAGLDGDSEAYAALLRAAMSLLRLFYSRRVSNPTEIDDLVQETLMAMHDRRASYGRDRPFTAWMFAIARYKMIDHFRRNRRTVPMEGLEEILVSEGFEQSSNAAMDVRRLLSLIPAKQARAIRDTRLTGWSVSEAAEQAGIGESDVKVSVHRGLKAIASRLKVSA